MGFFQDNKGNIIFIFSIHVGLNINNVVEIKALETSYQAFPKLFIEADSQLVINMITKIIHGRNRVKSLVASIWNVGWIE